MRRLYTDFDRTLANGPKDRWLDIGQTGQRHSDITPDYDLTHPEGQERQAKSTGSRNVHRGPKDAPMAAERQALEAIVFVQQTPAEYSREKVGQFQLITDVIGVSVRKIFPVCGEGSASGVERRFYAVLQDVH